MTRDFATKIKYDSTMEALRVIETLFQMQNGFYSATGFYVIPYKGKLLSDPSIIYMPVINYVGISRLWDRIKRIEYEFFPVKAAPDLIKQLESLILENCSQNVSCSKFEAAWQDCGDIFMENLSKLLNLPYSNYQLEVFVTRFGPRVSFNHLRNTDTTIKIYIREDAELQDLFYGVISSLTRVGILEGLGGDWSSAQVLSEWLLYRSSLSMLISEYLSNPKSYAKSLQKKQYGSVSSRSEEFYKKIGLQSGAHKFSIEDNTIYINEKPLQGLTKDETSVLSLLIKQKMITKDDIGDVLFKSDDNFSLYKISKLIERLRNKLEKNGISAAYLQTIRGEGYLLKN